MKVGDTFFGLDEANHLWMVLSLATAAGAVAIANLTTHDPARRRRCSDRCVVIHPEEHEYPDHDSCVYYPRASLTSLALLERGLTRQLYRLGAPLDQHLLERIQRGALRSPEVDRPVKAVIEASLVG